MPVQDADVLSSNVIARQDHRAACERGCARYCSRAGQLGSLSAIVTRDAQEARRDAVRASSGASLRLGRLRLQGHVAAPSLEFTLAAIAQNLRRLAKLVARPPPVNVRRLRCLEHSVQCAASGSENVSFCRADRLTQNYRRGSVQKPRPQTHPSKLTSATKSALNDRL